MKYLDYIFIVLGGLIAFYGESSKGQNTFLLIAGIVLLMIGVYRLSKKIPSKHDENNNDNENEQRWFLS